MLADTYTRRVLELAQQKGLLRSSDLNPIGVPRVVLTRLTAIGLLDRIGRGHGLGLCRLPGHPGTEHQGLTAIATKVPQAVLCLLSALLFTLWNDLPHRTTRWSRSTSRLATCGISRGLELLRLKTEFVSGRHRAVMRALLCVETPRASFPPTSRSSIGDRLSNLVDAHRPPLSPAMNDGMAVRANRNQVLFGVNRSWPFERGHRNEMMHMYEVLARVSVHFFHAFLADDTAESMNR